MATPLSAEVIQTRIVRFDDAALAALIDEALAFQIGFAMPALFRAEARIKAIFAKLDVVAARAMYERLIAPADRMALRFTRLAHGPQLLEFLRDAKRVNARG